MYYTESQPVLASAQALTSLAVLDFWAWGHLVAQCLNLRQGPKMNRGSRQCFTSMRMKSA